MSANQRIVLTREEMISKIVEVQTPPKAFQSFFDNFQINSKIKHIVSEYVIKPINCDSKPFKLPNKVI